MQDKPVSPRQLYGARTRAKGDFRYRTAPSIKQRYRRSLARLGSGGCRRFCLPTILRGNSRKRGDARGQSKRTPPNLCFARRLGDLGGGADRRLCAQSLVVGSRRGQAGVSPRSVIKFQIDNNAAPCMYKNGLRPTLWDYTRLTTRAGNNSRLLDSRMITLSAVVE